MSSDLPKINESSPSKNALRVTEESATATHTFSDYHIAPDTRNRGVSNSRGYKRGSVSMSRRNFDSEEEHRTYMARRRWRKVKIFLKASGQFSRRQTFPYVEKDGTVFWKIKLLYALPQFSLISLTMLINIQVLVFYNEIGVTLAFLSFFQIFARSFDVLTDPMMAHISDNLTKTRWGRRIPWMVLGSPFYAVAFLVLMSPQRDGMWPTFWFGASYLIFYLCDTVANIPLLALGPELSDDSEKRTDLFMWVKICEGLGTIVGGGTPAILLNFVPKTTAFPILALIFGGWYLASMFLLVRNVKERKQSQKQKGLPLVPAVFRSFRNIAFRPLVVAWILDFTALAMLVAVLPFYIAYYLRASNPDTMLGASVVVLFLVGFASIPLWRLISTNPSPDPSQKKWYDKIRVGKRNAWLAYNAFNAVSNFLLILVTPGDEILFVILMGLNGFPIGGQFLIWAIMCDVIDYDEFLNYTRQEGAFTVFSQFIPKLVAIPAQSLPLVVLFMLGYVDPIEDDDGDTVRQEQPKRVLIFLRIMFAVAPSLIMTLSFIIKRHFPIRNREIMNDIANGIEKHMKGLPATDPITKQSVVIEEYTEEEQYQVDLLDHFGVKQLILLLEPQTIVKRQADKSQDDSTVSAVKRWSKRLSFTVPALVNRTLSPISDPNASNVPGASPGFDSLAPGSAGVHSNGVTQPSQTQTSSAAADIRPLSPLSPMNHDGFTKTDSSGVRSTKDILSTPDAQLVGSPNYRASTPDAEVVIKYSDPTPPPPVQKVDSDSVAHNTTVTQNADSDTDSDEDKTDDDDSDDELPDDFVDKMQNQFASFEQPPSQSPPDQMSGVGLRTLTLDEGGSGNVRFVADPTENIVETKFFKSVGPSKGSKRIRRRMLTHICIGFTCVIVSALGVGNTVFLLKHEDWAFIPALFCLTIGASFVFTAFSSLRFRAAGDLQLLVQTNGFNDSLLKRVIYPKIKGQRGGIIISDSDQKAHVDLFTGGDEPTKSPGRRRRLSRFNLFGSHKKKSNFGHGHGAAPSTSGSGSGPTAGVGVGAGAGSGAGANTNTGGAAGGGTTRLRGSSAARRHAPQLSDVIEME